MKTLGISERSLYRKLLRLKMTIPGFLPVGDGLVNGLWEDVIIFDPKTWRRIAFPVIESWTCAPCERGRAIHYNMRFAGLTEQMMHPEEFRGEIMDFKRKLSKKWGKMRLFERSMPLAKKVGKAQGSRVIFTGLDPLRLVREHRVERSLYRAGFFLRPSSGENANCISIILPEDELSLAAIKRHSAIIVAWCEKYTDAPVVKREKFIPFPGAEKPRALSDQQCLRLCQRISRKRNTHSNQVFLPPKDVK